MASSIYAVLQAADAFLYNNINEKGVTAELINEQLKTLHITTCNRLYQQEIRRPGSRFKLIQKSNSPGNRYLTLTLTESEMTSRYPSWLYSRYKWTKGKTWSLVDKSERLPITISIDDVPIQESFELVGPRSNATTTSSTSPPEVPREIKIRPFKFRVDLPTKYAVEGKRYPESLVLYTHPIEAVAEPPTHTYIRFENGRYYANYKPDTHKTLNSLIKAYLLIKN